MKKDLLERHNMAELDAVGSLGDAPRCQQIESPMLVAGQHINKLRLSPATTFVLLLSTHLVVVAPEPSGIRGCTRNSGQVCPFREVCRVGVQKHDGELLLNIVFSSTYWLEMKDLVD